MKHHTSLSATTLLVIAFVCLTISNALGQETSVNNNTGLWITDATWTDASSPGYTNVPSFDIYGYVTSESSINMVDAPGQIINVVDTLVIEGDLTFATNQNFAEVNVGAGAVLVVFGTVSMGKNNAGINVSAGGVLVITGDVIDNGGGGNTITAVGDVYVGGSSADLSGGAKPITDLTGDGFGTVEDFVNGGGVNPLPVELLHFGAKSDIAVVLEWATASETNNDYFAIERSEDGSNFYEIDRVKGQGTSNQITTYAYTDKFPFSGVEYYRLRQYDFDGRNESLPVVRVETHIQNEAHELIAFPTIVTNGEVSIKSNQPFQLQELTVYNLSGGESVSIIQQSIQKNPLTYSIKLDQLRTGIYFLKAVTSTGTEQTTRLIIK